MRIQIYQYGSNRAVSNTLNLAQCSSTTVTLADDEDNELMRLSFTGEGKKIQITGSKRMKLNPGYECRFLQGEFISKKED